jgi:hypothetical protein
MSDLLPVTLHSHAGFLFLLSRTCRRCGGDICRQTVTNDLAVEGEYLGSSFGVCIGSYNILTLELSCDCGFQKMNADLKNIVDHCDGLCAFLLLWLE